MGIACVWLVCGLAMSVAFPAFLSAQKQSPKPSTAKQTKRQKASSVGTSFTLVGAGDIAGCDNLSGARATAALIAKIPGTVFAAGDLAYDNGTDAEFRDCY